MGVSPSPVHALDGVLGRSGSLEVRLARNAADVRRALRLRYRVFYEGTAATPGRVARLTRHDADRFDAICDHLLVIDRAGRKPRVVGVYRLLRQEVAARHGGFYTQGEFDIAALIARHPAIRFLELGRSCVMEEYRDKRTVELLWQGIWAYVRHHRIGAMFGCASFKGTDPASLAPQLGFLARHARAEEVWRVRAQPRNAVPLGAFATDAIDERMALRAMPPLIKGYLRLGAWFGDEASVDRGFDSIDVLTILPVARINPRYIDYFGAEGDRYAA